MTTFASPSMDLHTEHGRLVASLSDELHMPIHEVGAIYREQLDRLAAQARIQSFLSVLAVRNTRSVLRARTTRTPAGIHS